MYISRAGDDRWSCDQSKPCRNIWRAVGLASRGDRIYLDGTNTGKNPYTCQSGFSQHSGININKSLSLIGFGPIPSQIRCSEGTSLKFNGSQNVSKMEVTLSRLLLKETFVYFQDFSAKIDGCKFEGSRQGLQFVISNKNLSIIQITNSSFVRNSKCISVVANSTENVSLTMQLIVKLENSSFDRNTMSGNGWGIAFIESPHNNRPASCNITLDNVTFSRNKFSSRGLFFLKLESANQNIHLQDVTCIDNNLLPGRDFVAGYIHSEFIVRSAVVNVIINASKFTSQHVRLMNIHASIISLQIQNAHFRGHRVEGNGGALSLIGTVLCTLNVFKSSFVNTNASQGGAINAECEIVQLYSQDNTFTGNTAMHKGGGAVFIDTSGCVAGNLGESFQISINNSHFTSNYAGGSGGALSFSLPEVREERWRSSPCQITIENSTFSTNRASEMGGAVFVELINPQSIIILQNVIMESNIARNGGGLAIPVSIFALKVHQSKFLRNTAHMEGGVLYVGEVKRLEVEDSYFEGILPSRERPRFGKGFGGALFIPGTTLISRSISIINTTFKNFLTGKQGGVIYLAHLDEENVIFVVKRSRFVDNASFQNLGGAIFLSLAPDTQKDPGCLPESQNDAAQNYPSWRYKSHLMFEDTTFHRNAADVGGAVYLGNGKAIFRNCYFVDNFATTQGGHIYTVAGSASVIIKDSILRQTMNQLELLTVNFSKTSFIHTESSGALKVYNTTMDNKAYGSTAPLMLVTNGRLIEIGNWTEFYCPVGSEMDILDFSNLLTTQLCNTSCKLKVTTVSFSCSACRGNSYSLQRGRAIGSQLVSGFQCLPCPFGAKCAQNILAKANFWGFREQLNPPTVRFTMCPMGYCNPPEIADFPQYNGCQGNRSGTLCGHCNKNHTETLYSTHCRPSRQCNDFWFWPLAVIYVSLMALYFTFKPPFVPWIKRQILWFKETELVNHENVFDKGYLKILFHFYQVANFFLISNSSQLVIKTNLINPLVGLFNFQQTFSPSGFICSFPGLTVVTKQFFSASHVFGTFLMICAFYALHWVVQTFRGQGAPSLGPYVGGILQTLLLGYTTLASASFNLLRCVPIGSERRLFYDGNVVCFQWWQYILVAFVCTFVIPFVFVLLWGSYRLYGGSLSVGRFLLGCFFPLPSIIYWSFVSLFGKRINPVVEDPSPCQVSRNYVERVLYDSFNRPEDGGKLSLSWESVMIGRRLILVVLRAFVNDPLPRLLIMITFEVLFLLHHILTQPFRDSIANTVETISLLFIVVVGLLNAFFAAFLSLAVPPNNHFSSWWNVFQGAEVVILCLVPAIFVLLVVTAVLSQLCRIFVVVGRVLCNFCWICFRSCCNKFDETGPLLVPTS